MPLFSRGELLRVVRVMPALGIASTIFHDFVHTGESAMTKPMDEEAASGLGARIVAKINELISDISKIGKAQTANQTETETRLANLERRIAALESEMRGTKISRGKIAAQKRRLEVALAEARQRLQ